MYYGEKLNSITHLVGAVLALMGFGALLTVSIQQQNPKMILSFTVFGLTLVLLYTMSTLYHSFYSPKIKKIMQKLDHVAIYLLIAGTYTPYMLLTLGKGNGPVILASVWGMAVVGSLIDVLSPQRSEKLQIAIYLIMGWICTLEYRVLFSSLPTAGLWWLTIGGFCYTVGIIFYVMDHMNRLRHAHGIWHLFVLCGSISHFISIIGYVR